MEQNKRTHNLQWKVVRNALSTTLAAALLVSPGSAFIGAAHAESLSNVASMQSPSLTTDQITILSQKGKSDTVTVTVVGLQAGDVIRVYRHAKNNSMLGMATVASKQHQVEISIKQLGEKDGTLYVSLTQKGKRESERVMCSYTAVEKNPLLKAIADINAIQLTKDSTDEEYEVAVEAMAKALQNPVLALDFGQTYLDFTASQKSRVAEYMAVQTAVKPFLSKEEIQEFLTLQIEIVKDKQAAIDEIKKFELEVTLPSYTPLEKDITDKVLKLIPNAERNEEVSIKADHADNGDWENHLVAAEYLTVDSEGRIILKKYNTTNAPIVERAVFILTHGKGQAKLFIDVTIQPAQENDAELAALQELNDIKLSDSLSDEEKERAEKQLLEALKALEISLDQFNQLEKVSQTLILSQVLEALRHGSYLSKADVKQCFDQLVASEIAIAILGKEVHKYNSFVDIPYDTQPGTDLTESIIHLVDGETHNPDVTITATEIQGGTWDHPKEAELLELDSTGKIVLKKQNESGEPVSEKVSLIFTLKDFNNNYKMDVFAKFLPQISDEVKEALTAINSIKINSDSTYEEHISAINAMEQALHAPALALNLDNLNQLNQWNKQNPLLSLVYSIQAAPVTYPKEIQNRLDDVLPYYLVVQETEKYWNQYIVMPDIQPGDNLTSQIIELHEGETANPNITKTVEKVRGGAWENQTDAEYLELQNGEVTLKKQNTTGHSIIEWLYVTFTDGQNDIPFTIVVIIPSVVRNP